MRLILALLTLGAGWMLLTRGERSGTPILLPDLSEDEAEPESWLAAEAQAYRAEAQAQPGL